MNFFFRIIIALVSGLFLNLAFADWNVSSVAWLALIPFFYVLWMGDESKRKRSGFILGLAFGLGFWLINLRWLQTVSGFGNVLLAIYLALYMAVWSMLIIRISAWKKDTFVQKVLAAFVVAALWALFELARGYIISGFSWNGLGVATFQQKAFAQCADLFGVSGVSAVMVFVQAMVFFALKSRAAKLLDFAIVLSIFCFMLFYGSWRMAQKHETFSVQTLLVQANIPQEAARQTMEAVDIHARYEELVEKAFQEKPADSIDWLVLPEVALNDPYYTTDDGEHYSSEMNAQTIEHFLRGKNFSVIYGATELEGSKTNDLVMPKENPKSWNVLALLTKQEGLRFYRKKHLVMFGEYIPLLDVFPWLQKIYEQQAGTEFLGSYARGDSHEPISVDVRGQKLQIIPSICFEDTVARETRDFVKNDTPQIMVNVTNDGWFKESVAARQHFKNAAFRAIEFRRPMIRCANTGVTGIISPTGETKLLENQAGSTFFPGYLFADTKIPLSPSNTLYKFWGDIPLFLFGVVALILSFTKKVFAFL